MARNSLRSAGGGDHPPRLLIVDDDLLTQGRVRRVIQSARPSWELLRAETVDAALRELAAWGSVDIVLTGGLGGKCLELLDAVRTRFPDTVRIVNLAAESPAISVVSSHTHAVVMADAPTEKLMDVLDRAVAERRRGPRRPTSGVHQAPLPGGTKRTTG